MMALTSFWCLCCLHWTNFTDCFGITIADFEQVKTRCLANNYMFKVNNRNTSTRSEICSKLTIRTPERRQWRVSDAFIVNFAYISHLVLVFLLLNLSRYMPAGWILLKITRKLISESQLYTRTWLMWCETYKSSCMMTGNKAANMYWK